MSQQDRPRIAVLIPCYNEEVAIAQTVASFRAALPNAAIYVYDNNSTDRTSDAAAAAGAIVRHEGNRGKGNVVRRMFADIDADFYLIADGDATYDAAAAPALLGNALDNNLDMVVGIRRSVHALAYRPGHRFGNRMLTSVLISVFGRSFTDILSGYRVFSRRYVKSFPAFASGFEIEAEMTVHALRMRIPVGEVETDYYARPEGSTSKLSTYRDGLVIFSTIVNLLRQERPLFFFSVIGSLLALFAVVLAVPIVLTYLETGLVPRFPTAILSSAMMLLAFLFFFTGLILDTVVRGRRELLRLHYLAIAPAMPRPLGESTILAPPAGPAMALAQDQPGMGDGTRS
jgi:glycosyltransferase involved in cell wall biosynthesis